MEWVEENQPNTKNAPCGRVFVSGWRVGGVGGGEPAEHEKHALWSVFFVFGWSGGTAGGERVGISPYVQCNNKKKRTF